MDATQSKEVRDYLISRYISYGLLGPDGRRETRRNKALFEIFDPWIYPDDGHIPFCAKCQQEFEELKAKKVEKNTVEMTHNQSCLWQPYFVERFRRICPGVSVVEKRNQGRGAGNEKAKAKQ
jgi:hypothetical protein